MKVIPKIIITLLFLLSCTMVLAEEKYPTISTVNSHNCSQVKGSTKQFILVVKKGEDLPEVITRCANDAALSGASISGIGALYNPSLNYYNYKTKRYHERKFSGMYELISLSGNVTHANGKRVTHLHVAISNDQFHMIGGHLSKGVVGLTAEVTITPFKGVVMKKVDDETGLELITTKA